MAGRHPLLPLLSTLVAYSSTPPPPAVPPPVGHPERAGWAGGARRSPGRRARGVTRVEASGEKLWPDTLDIMGWSVDPEGFGVIFQRTIPDFVQEHMGPAVAEMVGKMNFPLAEIDRFVCHPGSAKVIAALERAL